MLNFGLAVLSALLLIFALPRFNVSLLAPVALAPLLYACAREARPRRRLLLGWICGIVYWFGVCYWIQFVLSFHGGLGEVVGWAVFLLFCLAKALHMAVFALLAGWAIRGWWALPGVAALWVAIEFTHGFLGFAWLALGNAGINMGIPMRLAPVTGVHGISFAFAMMACALTLAALRRSRLQIAWLLALPLMILLAPLPNAEKGRSEAVLVQPDISETEDWTTQSLQRTERQLALLTIGASGNPVPSLVVWPEVPAPFYADDPRFLEYAASLARETQTYLLLGVVAHTPDRDPLNSALLLSPQGQPVARYDKIKLVPFGEFVPWPFGFAKHISTEVGDFAAGDKVVVAPAGGGHRIGTFICYESVFPHLVRRFAANGAEVLFNISNDGWFGKTAAREQHLNIVRMRAAENRRWILRSTNDGITATIDSAGRLRGTLPLYTQAASRSGFTYIAEQTVYTRFGDWFALSCAVIAAAAVVAGWRSA